MRRILLVLVVAAMMAAMTTSPVFAQGMMCQWDPITGYNSCNNDPSGYNPYNNYPDEPANDGTIPFVEDTLDVWQDVADVVEDLYPQRAWWQDSWDEYYATHLANPDAACYWWGDEDASWGCVLPQ